VVVSRGVCALGRERVEGRGGRFWCRGLVPEPVLDPVCLCGMSARAASTLVKKIAVV
jgi:hypothetical protein